MHYFPADDEVGGQRIIAAASPDIRGLAYLQGRLITAVDSVLDTIYDHAYAPELPTGSPLGPLEPKIDRVPVRLPDLTRRHQPLSTVISEVAATANCVWGVAPDRYFYLRQRGAHLVRNPAHERRGHREGSLPAPPPHFFDPAPHRSRIHRGVGDRVRSCNFAQPVHLRLGQRTEDRDGLFEGHGPARAGNRRGAAPRHSGRGNTVGGWSRATLVIFPWPRNTTRERPMLTALRSGWATCGRTGGRPRSTRGSP